jgi:hypothetical protein
MNFDAVFSAVAHKRLARVDLSDQGSHQHELNGSTALRDFFSSGASHRGQIEWTLFCDDSEPTSETGEYNFYDARARSADRTGRSEWRMYYRGEPLAGASAGDLLVLARTNAGDVHALVFARDSGWERAALQLFPIERDTEQLSFLPESRLANTQVDALRLAVMDRLDIAYTLPISEDVKEVVLTRFGLSFPKTAEMGGFARERVGNADRSPDELLMAWLDEEERLFRALEELIVSEKLESGFDSIDDFLAFSLSVQNRRKSRMGHALEHHLAALFDLHNICYSRQVKTEGNRTADFVFPGAEAYHDPGFSPSGLTVLAAKSTCKDRWPQVLADADRIPVKHLGTLDTALSVSQLADITSKYIVLVMPETVRAVYGDEGSILNLCGFLEHVAKVCPG